MTELSKDAYAEVQTMIDAIFSTAPSYLAAGGSGSAGAATGDKAFWEYMEEAPEETKDSVLHPLDQPLLDAPTFYAAGMEALAHFEQLMRERLEVEGVAPEPPMEFDSDAFGMLHLTSAHPQAGQIAKILEDDKELAHYFNKASANLAIQRAGEEHARFSAVYAENPDLAVQMYSHLFDDRPPPSLTIQLSANAAQPLFR